jgi:hypothetical protein
MKTTSWILLAALSAPALWAAPAAWAMDANDVRGGWETTIDGSRHIYDFEIDGRRVTGVYCTDCADATTLAFVEGTLETNDIRFIVRHVREDGTTAYEDQAIARIEGDHLAVSGRAGGGAGGAFHWAMHKDPRGPAAFVGVAVSAVLPQPGAPPKNVAAYGAHGQQPPAPRPLAPAFRAPPYRQPGPWRQITPAQLVGVWFAGTGAAKQHFIIRRVGNRLLGMVCGPCDNPYTMAAIDEFHIRGDTLTFRIHHEDFGLGTLPFYNLITAHLGRNELRIDSAVANNLPVQQQALAHFAFSLIGPVAFKATAAP